jgi:hypothetical protein
VSLRIRWRKGPGEGVGRRKSGRESGKKRAHAARRPLSQTQNKTKQNKTKTYTTAIVRLADAGEDVNEVEAAGNTPLHACAWQGWPEGARLLLQLGAKAGATNNAGEGAWHWAERMGHAGVAALLEEVRLGLVLACCLAKERGRKGVCSLARTHHAQTKKRDGKKQTLLLSLLSRTRKKKPRPQNGASKEKGPVLVPEHVPKVKDFFSRACWAHHPLPYADYVAAQKADAAALEEERRKLPRVPAAGE